MNDEQKEELKQKLFCDMQNYTPGTQVSATLMSRIEDSEAFWLLSNSEDRIQKVLKDLDEYLSNYPQESNLVSALLRFFHETDSFGFLSEVLDPQVSPLVMKLNSSLIVLFTIEEGDPVISIMPYTHGEYEPGEVKDYLTSLGLFGHPKDRNKFGYFVSRTLEDIKPYFLKLSASFF